MATADSTWSAFLSHLVKSAKMFCALKDVKDFVCKWYPSLEVEVPTALLLHMTRCSIYSNSSIILPRAWAPIGVTCSYSSRLFLCAHAHTSSTYTLTTVCTVGAHYAYCCCIQNTKVCSSGSGILLFFILPTLFNNDNSKMVQVFTVILA